MITSNDTASDLTTIASVSPHTMTWTGQTNGAWTDSDSWSDAPPSYPNSLIDAVVNTASTITVDSLQVANSLDLSNGGTVVVASGGSLSIGGGVTLSSGSNVDVEMGGTLALSDLINSSDPAAVNIDGGSLQANASFISATPIMLGVNGATVDTNSQDVTLSGPISGVIAGNGLTKAGSGTLTLSGTNSYSGATVVSAGMLVIGDSDNLPSGGSLTVGSGGIFVFDPKASVATTLLVGNTTLDPIAALGGQNQSSVAASADASAIPSPASLAPASSLQDPSAYSAAAIGGTGETVLSLATETVSQTPNSGKLLTALTTVSSTDLQSRGGLIEAHLAIASNSSGHSSVVAATLPGRGNLIPVAFGTSYAESHAVAFATVAKSDLLGAKSGHTGQAAGAAISDRASVDQAMASGASWLWGFLKLQAQQQVQNPDEAIFIRDMIMAEYAS